MKFHTMLAICFTVALFPGVANSMDSVVVVRDAWIRESPPNATSLAGYMVMENPSDKNQIVQSVSADTFAKVMIHRTEIKGGMARMTHQKQVTIPAGGTLKFAPGGYHLMLMNPKQSLRAGDKVIVKFVFANKSRLSVNFKVRKGMAMKCGAGMKH
jgi:copper(I)-binding protein